jgi:hypothetical protein
MLCLMLIRIILLHGSTGDRRAEDELGLATACANSNPYNGILQGA